MHFRQFDANSRKLAQGQGGVLRYVPDARVATLTQKSRKMAEMQKPVLSDSEIGRQKPVLSDSEIGRLPKMHFRQFDANSRKLAQGQGGVLRYVPDARVATLTQKSRKMAEMPRINGFCLP